MLAEILHYVATPAGRDARRSGALKDAVALWARGRRCRRAWTPHEERTRAAIDRAIEATPGRGVAVVLGSGLLRDVPIERMRSLFREVVLVDVVHLAAVRLRARAGRWSNVTFVQKDISGFSEMVERVRIQRATGQSDIGGVLDPLAFVRWMAGVDLVVSANVLSQIAVGTRQRIERGGQGAALLTDDAPARAVRAHLDALATFSCKTVLVTDTRYERRDRSGAVVETTDLLEGEPLPEADESWCWVVAPFGETGGEVEQIHTVVAIEDVAEELR